MWGTFNHVYTGHQCVRGSPISPPLLGAGSCVGPSRAGPAFVKRHRVCTQSLEKKSSKNIESQEMTNMKAQIKAEIRDANMAYLNMAQSFIQKDLQSAVKILGMSQDAAEIIKTLSESQKVRKPALPIATFCCAASVSAMTWCGSSSPAIRLPSRRPSMPSVCSPTSCWQAVWPSLLEFCPTTGFNPFNIAIQGVTT